MRLELLDSIIDDRGERSDSCWMQRHLQFADALIACMYGYALCTTQIIMPGRDVQLEDNDRDDRDGGGSRIRGEV